MLEERDRLEERDMLEAHLSAAATTSLKVLRGTECHSSRWEIFLKLVNVR